MSGGETRGDDGALGHVASVGRLVLPICRPVSQAGNTLRLITTVEAEDEREVGVLWSEVLHPEIL